MAVPKKQDKPETPEEAVEQAVEKAEPAESADVFPIERLITEGGAILGYEPHIVSGALDGLSEKELTVKEAKAAVVAWLKSPVTKED